VNDRLQLDVANTFDQLVALDVDPVDALRGLAERLQVPLVDVVRAVHRWSLDWDEVPIGHG